MPTSRALILLLLAAVTVGACRRPRSRLRTAPVRKETTPRLADPAYQGDKPLLARAYVLHQRWAPKQPSAFARLDGAEAQAYERLRPSSVLRIRVFALTDRLLVLLPSTHPAASLQLLLADDRPFATGLTVFAPDKWSYQLTRSALPDVLDRATPSQRELGDDAPRQAVAVPPSLLQLLQSDRRSLLSALRVAVPLRYRSTAEQRDWSVRAQLTVVVPAQPTPLLGPHRPSQQPLLSLALPLVQLARGAGLMETLGLTWGEPLAWQLEVDNETKSSGAAPRFAVRVEDRGWVSLPREHFATQRQGFRQGGRLPPPDSDGRQIVDRARLSALRRGASGGTLRVRNDSPVAAFVHIDGLRLGWVAAGHELSFEGLNRGYYRVYAHSPSGVRSWGPRDLYLPGELLLP